MKIIDSYYVEFKNKNLVPINGDGFCSRKESDESVYYHPLDSRPKSLKWIEIGDKLINLLENIENDVKCSKKKRINRELFYYETKFYFGERINSEIIAKSFANKIKNYFNDENNKLRNIPITEIMITGSMTEYAEIKIFCIFK